MGNLDCGAVSMCACCATCAGWSPAELCAAFAASIQSVRIPTPWGRSFTWLAAGCPCRPPLRWRAGSCPPPGSPPAGCPTPCCWACAPPAAGGPFFLSSQGLRPLQFNAYDGLDFRLRCCVAAQPSTLHARLLFARALRLRFAPTPAAQTPAALLCCSWDLRPWNTIFTVQSSPCASPLLPNSTLNVTALQPLRGR